MANVNVVMLGGNLTSDPQVRNINENSIVCNLRMAINRKFTSRSGEQKEDACFIDVDVFGKQAENCSQFLRKGSPILVEGRLQLDQWQDKETGKNRSRLKVIGNRIQFLSSRNREEKNYYGSESTPFPGKASEENDECKTVAFG